MNTSVQRGRVRFNILPAQASVSHAMRCFADLGAQENPSIPVFPTHLGFYTRGAIYANAHMKICTDCMALFQPIFPGSHPELSTAALF